jgi:site-specific recombinase XerD
MNGRQENQKLIENKIKDKLEGRPKYLVDYSKTFGDKTVRTKYAYLNYVIDFLDYLKEELNYDITNPYCFSEIRTSTINGYSEYIKYKTIKDESGNDIVTENGASIRASKIYAIKNFFSFLCDDQYINDDPSVKVSIPKEKNEIKVIALDENEVDILKNNIINGVGSSKAKKRQAIWKNRDLAIVMIGLVTGLRVESLVEINVEDIDFQSYSINVSEKGNKARTCYIGDNTMNVLKEWIKDREEILNGEQCDALFLSSIKKNDEHVRITTSGVRKLVNKYTININKHITPHKLRSTCATTTYKHTGDIYLTASVLGHANIQNTRRYAMVADSERRTAASKLDNIFG